MNKLSNTILFILTCYGLPTMAQWDQDAGYVPAHTVNATTTASSNVEMAHNVLDENFESKWQSIPPLPLNYIERADQNFLLNQGNTYFNSPGISDFSVATDGELLNNALPISTINGTASLSINFPSSQELLYISIKANATDTIYIYTYTSPTDSTAVGIYDPVTDNFATLGYAIPFSPITQLKLYSSGGFGIFELGALSQPPKEYVIVDLGSTLDIGTIFTKYWPGYNAAIATKLYLSNDAVTWEEVADLDPDNPLNIQIFLPPGTTGRYIKIEHTLTIADYVSVFVWETQVYDEFGKFGPFLSPAMSNQTLKDMVGINAIWGWGHNVCSDNLLPGQGPDQHNVYASHGRNYHFMNWDVADPDDPIDFANMASGNGTPVHSWLNWDTEYQAWIDAGLEVQATIQFGPYWADTEWDNPFQSAYDYGYNFAYHFGPTHGKGLVRKMEVGNEPWYYDAAIYRQILEGMASGAKAADPAMEVYPCALQAYEPYVETTASGFRNYMGARVTPTEAPYLDGINIHNYGFIRDITGERIALHPEHPGAQFNGIRNAIRFRNQNMPGQKILLSETGWDSNSSNENCTHSECVPEESAAVYIPRSAMIAQRYGLDRISYFFYANEEAGSSLFTRSGLTESGSNNFSPKKTFVAIQTLVDSLGDAYFLDIFQEDESGYVYLFGNADGEVTHLAGWLPIAGNDNNTNTVYYPSDLGPASAIRIDGEDVGGTPIPLPDYDSYDITLTLSTQPILIRFAEVPCIRYDTTYINSNTCTLELAGTIENTYTNLVGCDSIVIEIINLLPSDTIQIQSSTCDPLSSGTDSLFLVNQYGCDSIVVTINALNPTDTTHVYKETCNSLETSVEVDYYNNQFGCDSTVFITTILLPNDTLYALDYSCDPMQEGIDTLVYENAATNSCSIYLVTTTELLPSDTLWREVETCNPRVAGQNIAVFQNHFGCDSVIITNIHLLPSDTTIQISNICPPLLPTQDTLFLSNQHGCDSFVITATELFLADTTVLQLETCDPLLSGNDTLFLQNQNNCDSIVINTTTLLPSDTTIFNSSTCNPAEAGSDTLFLNNSFNCDSIVITTVELSPIDTLYGDSETCMPEKAGQDTSFYAGQDGCNFVVITSIHLLPSDTVWIFEETCDIDLAGENTTTFTNQYGCDSSIITITELLPADTIIQQFETCDPSLAGNDTLFLQNQNNCDSIVISATNLLPSDTTYFNDYTCDPLERKSDTSWFNNSFNCDSIVINTIDLLPSDTTYLNSYTCDPLETNSDTSWFSNSFNCDSIVIENVILSATDTLYGSSETCDPSQAGQDTLVLLGQDGCDFIVINTVDLLPTDTTYFWAETCNADLAGEEITILSNQYGCDSILLLTTIYEPLENIYGNAVTCDPMEAGLNTIELTNGDGCNFLVITNNILLLSDEIYQEFPTCTHEDAGQDTSFYINQYGCDSLVITSSIFVPADTIYQDLLVCSTILARQDTALISGATCDFLLITTFTPLEEDLFLDNGNIENSSYHVINNITSDALMPANSQVEFKAGNCIELLPGFEVEFGDEFDAVIEECEDN